MTAHIEREFDVIVIGAGAVGENVAERVVKGGLTAVLVEAELVGGECSYWACMPSKALLRPGAALHGAQTVPGAEEAVTRVLDAAAVLKRRDYFTSNWQDDSQVKWAEETGIELIRGHGWITGPRRAEVAGLDGNSYALTARHAVVVATGSRPSIPPVEGLADVDFWTTREATSAQEIPPRLGVLGGGVAGTELAQAFARLGASVTVVARGGLLGAFPAPAAELVHAGLRADGVELHLRTGTQNVHENEDGSLTLALDGGGRVTVDKLLVATGRHPALEGIGLESVGLAGEDGTPTRLRIDASGLVVGADGNEEAPWLYAVGDAAGKVLLTHQGKYEARATGDAIAARARGTLAGEPAPWSPYARTPTNTPCPTSSSPTPSWQMWAAAWNRPSRTATGPRPWNSRSRWRDPHCTPSTTRAGPSSWSTRTAKCSWGRRSPVPTWPSCCTRRRSPSSARSRWTGSGTPSRPTPPSARCGCGCSKSTASERERTRGALNQPVSGASSVRSLTSI